MIRLTSGNPLTENETMNLSLTDLYMRLKAYEDTGLEPEVCTEYKKFEDEAVSKGVTFNRIVELMNAQQAGRLVVLPEARDVDRKNFRELLEDTFKEASAHDPSVGIYGMSDGERKLAAAIMTALTVQIERGSK